MVSSASRVVVGFCPGSGCLLPLVVSVLQDQLQDAHDSLVILILLQLCCRVKKRMRTMEMDQKSHKAAAGWRTPIQETQGRYR